MARMIPATIDPDTPSPGEIEIFRRIRDDPGTEDWIALHSLDIAEHRRTVAGEIDFVVLIPYKGVLCLEVKSHFCISVDAQGYWLFGPRQEQGKSPFKQVSAAMHSVRSWLEERDASIKSVPFWTAVILSRVDLQIDSPEWHEWQLLDARKLRARPISRLLTGVLDHARDLLAQLPDVSWFHPQAPDPDPHQCEAIAHTLRPVFEAYESPKDRRRRADVELKHFTEEQFRALDSMVANPRVVFAGPAGTGKTLLAIEAARRASASQRVLLLCYNELLGKWLGEQTSSLQPRVTARTMHAHMLSVAGVSVPSSGSDTAFWQEMLPARATDRLLEEVGEAHVFDLLIVDEAQDLLRPAYLDFLDLSVRGGLAAGHILLFGDFEKQALYGVPSDALKQFLQERCVGAAVYSLRDNCRNTPRVVEYVRLLCDLEPDYKRVLRQDDQITPEIYYYGGPDQQRDLLIRSLEALRADAFSSDEIVVLSPKSDNSAIASTIQDPPWRDRLRAMRSTPRGHIRYTTIQAFKGLEAPAVVVTDIDRIDDDQSKALFYIAITRPLHRLVILINSAARADIVAALVQRLGGRLSESQGGSQP